MPHSALKARISSLEHQGIEQSEADTMVFGGRYNEQRKARGLRRHAVATRHGMRHHRSAAEEKRKREARERRTFLAEAKAADQDAAKILRAAYRESDRETWTRTHGAQARRLESYKERLGKLYEERGQAREDARYYAERDRGVKSFLAGRLARPKADMHGKKFLAEELRGLPGWVFASHGKGIGWDELVDEVQRYYPDFANSEGQLSDELHSWGDWRQKSGGKTAQRALGKEIKALKAEMRTYARKVGAA